MFPDFGFTLASFASLAVIGFFGSVEIAGMGDEVADQRRMVGEPSGDRW